MLSRLIFALLFIGGNAAWADLNDGSCANSQKQTIKSSHTAMINGQRIDYQAAIGFLEVTSLDQTAKACIFYTAYTVPPQHGETRPLTFAFNGGPGSSSVWLHLGLLGPVRVDMGLDGLTPAAGPTLIANDSSLLDTTDIVVIDPVATGFSHTENGASGDHFFGVKNDYTSIARFVQNYLNTYNRWDSPKYILGESYGGIRGSLLASYLQSDMNIRVAGLILISPALSNQTFFSTPDNLTPFITHFPSYAATAWYHHTIAPRYALSTVDQVYAEAEQFAQTRLQADLLMGDELDQTERDNIAQAIADFTGLSQARVLAMDLRIMDWDFFTLALENQNLIIGRYDSRFTQANTGQYADPSGAIPGYAFAAGINEYLRTGLGFTDPIPYNIFGNLTSWPQDRDGTDVMPAIASALGADPNFRLMIANGYYDLACPMGTASYELRQLKDGKTFADRTFHTRYPSGHMIYLNPAALPRLKADIAGFITGSPPVLLPQARR